MKIILISGLSGSGKSVALKQLEDLGYYCVDNLPMDLLPALVARHIDRQDEAKLGVSVDIRSRIDIAQAQMQIQYLRDEGHQVEVLFVEAEESVLVRRFSETRRGHPLSGQNMTLLESLQKERQWLFPLRDLAYCIDTSKMNTQQLRYAVQQWLHIERRGLLVILESFGFKYGAPSNADFMFDMRSLPNPYYDPICVPIPAWINRFRIISTSSRWRRKCCTTSALFSNIGCRVCSRKAAAMLPSLLVVPAGNTAPFIWWKNWRNCCKGDMNCWCATAKPKAYPVVKALMPTFQTAFIE